MTKEDFKECDLKLDLTTLLAKEAKFFKEKPKLPSSSYLSLEEMLEKYDIRKFKLCVDDILRSIKNMGPFIDNNEALRCEYSLYEQGISLTEDALNGDTDLLKNVKRVLEGIVGLLKEPATKKHRVEEKIKKNNRLLALPIKNFSEK
ncbi:hypothetical protein C1646_770904 [Rhizophagus diaphanus]|nr:hypothetical protein C1646_770904 [Rhizophagus diaphanus] [Rhizophagus sp. MUCL 43196]